MQLRFTKKPVLRSSAYAGMLFNGLGRPIDLDRPCQTLPASMGGNKTPFIDTRLLRNPSAENWMEKTHAMAMAGQSLSELKVPSFVRRITVSEAAALQGFPRSFKFFGSRCDQYKQIGNSVPPPLAYCIAREVMKRFMS
ncbi:MAG: DNA cytosine methyltransferase [Kiritimatiellae bacterium]|nr:DNA cytosine methyltransferase [Kiritimatiellia bacterium]